jgi:hypothetical protein
LRAQVLATYLAKVSAEAAAIGKRRRRR